MSGILTTLPLTHKYMSEEEIKKEGEEVATPATPETTEEIPA